MFNSLMPSLKSRSLPFVEFLGGFPSRCQNLSSGAIRPGGLLSPILTVIVHLFKICSVIVPCHGEAIGGNIKMLGVRLCVRASVRPSVTKLVSAITSDFMHRFTQYLTQ